MKLVVSALLILVQYYPHLLLLSSQDHVSLLHLFATGHLYIFIMCAMPSYGVFPIVGVILTGYSTSAGANCICTAGFLNEAMRVLSCAIIPAKYAMPESRLDL